MLKMTMPDGAIRDYDKESVTPLEIAESISHGLAKKLWGRVLMERLTTFYAQLPKMLRLQS